MFDTVIIKVQVALKTLLETYLKLIKILLIWNVFKQPVLRRAVMISGGVFQTVNHKVS